MKAPMRLRVEPKENGGYQIFLDNTEIHHVKEYKIESSELKGKAELSIKLLVDYPVNQENAS